MRVMLDHEPTESFEVGDRVVVYSGFLQGELGTIRYTPRNTRNGYYDVVLDRGGSCLVFEHSLKPAPKTKFQVGNWVQIRAAHDENTGRVGQVGKCFTGFVRPYYRVNLGGCNCIYPEEYLKFPEDEIPSDWLSERDKNHNQSLLWNLLLSEARRVLRNNISPYAADEDEAPSLTIPRLSDETTLTVGDLRALAREEKEDTRWT